MSLYNYSKISHKNHTARTNYDENIIRQNQTCKETRHDFVISSIARRDFPAVLHSTENKQTNV